MPGRPRSMTSSRGFHAPHTVRAYLRIKARSTRPILRTTMLHRIVLRSSTLALPQRRTVRTSSFLYDASVKHTADSYTKDDVDPTPPSDSSVYRVDASSENVQKPHEAPSGQWSRAGIKTSEYQSMSKTEPYTVPGSELRYGGKEALSKDKGPETSKSDEGPDGKASGGRIPEKTRWTWDPSTFFSTWDSCWKLITLGRMNTYVLWTVILTNCNIFCLRSQSMAPIL